MYLTFGSLVLKHFIVHRGKPIFKVTLSRLVISLFFQTPIEIASSSKVY
jgi:hypothetical protein